jgi:hypothetical protein
MSSLGIVMPSGRLPPGLQQPKPQTVGLVSPTQSYTIVRTADGYINQVLAITLACVYYV